MSIPRIPLPDTTKEFYAEIGQRLHEQASAAIPDHVRELLPAEILNSKINEKAAIDTTHEWRGRHNFVLSRLAKLAADALQAFNDDQPEALQVFRQRLTSEYRDVDNFLSDGNEPAQKYLMELIVAYIDDADQFPKLLELLIRLGNGRP